LVAIGLVVGATAGVAGARWVCASSGVSDEVTGRLLAVQDRAQLLGLLEAGRSDALPSVLERSLVWELAEADRLTEAGSLPTAFPAFLGESLTALSKLEAYGVAHGLGAEIVGPASRVRARLEAAYARKRT
jgi:hypothetical protein